MKKDKKPLYRKKNTHIIDQWLPRGGDYRWSRHLYKNDFETTWLPMSTGHGVSYDYNPLYRYLGRSIGRNWNDIYSEILPRLPKGKEGYVAAEMWVGHSIEEACPYYIDENNILQKKEFFKRVNSIWDFKNNCWEEHYSNEPYEISHPSISEYYCRFKDLPEMKGRTFTIYVDKEIITVFCSFNNLIHNYGNIRSYETSDYLSYSEIYITDKDFIKDYLSKKRKKEKLLRKKENRHLKHRKITNEEVVENETDI